MATSTPQRSASRERTVSGVRSTSSSSSSTAIPQSAASPISMEGLLARHSASSNPPIAALQQAVHDFNTLAAQNSQLWKLIEKQRNGYGQIMKELERVRGERDSYRARLHSKSSQSSDHPPPRRHQTSEADKSQTLPSGLAQQENRPHPTRHYTDEHPTPTQPYVQPRSIEQNGISPTDHLSRSTSRNVDTQRATLAPLAVSPSVDSNTPSLASGASATQETAPFGRHHADSDASLPSFVSTDSSGRPSTADETNQHNPSIVFSEHRSRSYSNASGNVDPPAPPQTAPAGHDSGTFVSGPPPFSAPPANSAMLGINRVPSRDSPASTPDECQRPFPTTVESPMNSPRQDGSFSRDIHNQSLRTVRESDRTEDFLNLDDGGDDSDDEIIGESEKIFNYGKEQLPTIAATQKSALMTPERPVKSLTEDSNSPFRALPLLPQDLPYTQIRVSASSVRPNDRGKDVLSFSVYIKPGPNKEAWRVDKLYSDIIALDQRVRVSVSKSVVRKIASLPEPKLWKDHAPVKVDQRKAALEAYLQSLINLPVKEKHEIIAFFTSDIVRETQKPVMKAGYKEGYLTKRGKNFGGWKSRFFVLAGPDLEYYESRGGAHLGSIHITGAQIGRQQRATDKLSGEDDKEYRHAFLIVEAKKGPGGNHPRHVLCAESDAERDSWVEMLVRYFSGAYNEETSPLNWGAEGPPRQSTSTPPPHHPPPPLDTPSNSLSGTPRRPGRTMSKDDVYVKGVPIPISQLTPDQNNAKLFQAAPYNEHNGRSGSPPKPSVEPPTPPMTFSEVQVAKRIMERGTPSSLPDSSPLASNSSIFPHADADDAQSPVEQRANSEQGHYPDLEAKGRLMETPQHQRIREAVGSERKNRHHTPASTSSTAYPERGSSPDKMDKVKISGPINGAPIPAGVKFGRETPPEASPSNDRREKAKSRSFWGFGRPMGEKSSHHASSLGTSVSRGAVFGVPLEESLEVAKIADLPAIVFRCIQYLEANKAEQEEGIYRLSGSSAVVKNLKDRFNNEGDVDLMASDEFWDLHAVAGLLKGFLRDLPTSILTRDLHMKFLAVMDFADPEDRVHELANLISALPISNYTLLRALTAHLILVVQNAEVNKMTVRNVGIVFNPTLGIPAGVFSLMLGEFNRVFNVDAESTSPIDPADAKRPQDPLRRNSQQYTDGAADQMLGLSGRSLPPNSVAADESDSDDVSIDVSDTEDGVTAESTSTSAGPSHGSQEIPTTVHTSKAANVAASRGLNVAVTDRGNRHSRVMGLPMSPRPPPSPATQRTPTQH